MLFFYGNRDTSFSDVTTDTRAYDFRFIGTSATMSNTTICIYFVAATDIIPDAFATPNHTYEYILYIHINISALTGAHPLIRRRTEGQVTQPGGGGCGKYPHG